MVVGGWSLSRLWEFALRRIPNLNPMSFSDYKRSVILRDFNLADSRESLAIFVVYVDSLLVFKKHVFKQVPVILAYIFTYPDH